MNDRKQINFAGGSPAAITNDLASVVCWVSQMASSSISHFFLLRQRKSNQKEGDPGLPPLRGSLRCSTGQAAAELALRAQTVLAEIP
jgi:hypothetical protein